MFKNAVDVIIFLVGISPLIFGVSKLIAQKTHNQKMYNFIDRMQVIVDSLQQTDFTNEFKKTTALNKGLEYAKEIGFTITPDQAEDYLESAVVYLKQQEAANATKQKQSGNDESSKASRDIGFH